MSAQALDLYRPILEAVAETNERGAQRLLSLGGSCVGAPSLERVHELVNAVSSDVLRMVHPVACDLYESGRLVRCYQGSEPSDEMFDLLEAAVLQITRAFQLLRVIERHA